MPKTEHKRKCAETSDRTIRRGTRYEPPFSDAYRHANLSLQLEPQKPNKCLRWVIWLDSQAKLKSVVTVSALSPRTCRSAHGKRQNTDNVNKDDDNDKDKKRRQQKLLEPPMLDIKNARSLTPACRSLRDALVRPVGT